MKAYIITETVMRRMHRGVALLTCVIFLQTSLFSSSPAQAAPAAQAVFPVLPLSFDALQIPEEIGKVDDTFTGTSDFKVIVVQDAHAIPDAQRSIRKAILYFHQKYGVNLIALEGASAKLDARMLKSFPDKDRLNKVLGEYFDQGELAGGTAAAISGIKAEDNSAVGTRLTFHGVEDWPVYEEALGLYLEAMGQEKEVLKELEVGSGPPKDGSALNVAEKLEEGKRKQYSAELQKIDAAVKAFRSNSSDFMKTLEVLASVKAPAEGSELELLLQEARSEGADQAGAEVEVKMIAERIRVASRQSSVASEKLKEFEQKYQGFRTGQLTAKAFALFLREFLEASPVLYSRLKTEDFRHRGDGGQARLSASLKRLSGNERRMRDIEGTKLFSDFEAYAQSVKESLFKTEQDRELDREDRKLWLLTKLAKLELSYEEWTEIAASAFGLLAMTKKGELPETLSLRSAAGGEAILELFKPHFAFYKNAQKRDEIFHTNLQKLLRANERRATSDEPRHTAILVAGGFHAHGLCSLLKENGISYALVMPEIKNIPEQSNYRQHMQGNVSWKNYFEVKDGKVNLYNAFIRGTRDRLLGPSRESSVVSREKNQGLSPLPQGTVPSKPQDPRLLKNWRDQIIRDLADEGRIEKAGEYTRFIDELTGEGRDQGIQKRLAQVDQFLEDLKKLDAQGQFTAPNIAKLFQPVATADWATYGGAITPNGPLLNVERGGFDFSETKSAPKALAASEVRVTREAATAKSEVLSQDVNRKALTPEAAASSSNTQRFEEATLPLMTEQELQYISTLDMIFSRFERGESSVELAGVVDQSLWRPIQDGEFTPSTQSFFDALFDRIPQVFDEDLFGKEERVLSDIIRLALSHNTNPGVFLSGLIDYLKKKPLAWNQRQVVGAVARALDTMHVTIRQKTAAELNFQEYFKEVDGSGFDLGTKLLLSHLALFLKKDISEDWERSFDDLWDRYGADAQNELSQIAVEQMPDDESGMRSSMAKVALLVLFVRQKLFADIAPFSSNAYGSRFRRLMDAQESKHAESVNTRLRYDRQFVRGTVKTLGIAIGIYAHEFSHYSVDVDDAGEEFVADVFSMALCELLGLDDSSFIQATKYSENYEMVQDNPVVLEAHARARHLLSVYNRLFSWALSDERGRFLPWRAMARIIVKEVFKKDKLDKSDVDSFARKDLEMDFNGFSSLFFDKFAMEFSGLLETTAQKYFPGLTVNDVLKLYEAQLIVAANRQGIDARQRLENDYAALTVPELLKERNKLATAIGHSLSPEYLEKDALRHPREILQGRLASLDRVLLDKVINDNKQLGTIKLYLDESDLRDPIEISPTLAQDLAFVATIVPEIIDGSLVLVATDSFLTRDSLLTMMSEEESANRAGGAAVRAPGSYQGDSPQDTAKSEMRTGLDISKSYWNANAPGKKPWEMTEEEFKTDIVFHGTRKHSAEDIINNDGNWLVLGFQEDDLTFGSDFTEDYGEASLYAKATIPGMGENGLVFLGTREAFQLLPRGTYTDAAHSAISEGGYKKDKVTGKLVSTKARTGYALGAIPAFLENPYRYVIEQAISAGENVPAEILDQFKLTPQSDGTARSEMRQDKTFMPPWDWAPIVPSKEDPRGASANDLRDLLWGVEESDWRRTQGRYPVTIIDYDANQPGSGKVVLRLDDDDVETTMPFIPGDSFFTALDDQLRNGISLENERRMERQLEKPLYKFAQYVGGVFVLTFILAVLELILGGPVAARAPWVAPVAIDVLLGLGLSFVAALGALGVYYAKLGWHGLRWNRKRNAVKIIANKIAELRQNQGLRSELRSVLGLTDEQVGELQQTIKDSIHPGWQGEKRKLLEDELFAAATQGMGAYKPSGFETVGFILKPSFSLISFQERLEWVKRMAPLIIPPGLRFRVKPIREGVDAIYAWQKRVHTNSWLTKGLYFVATFLKPVLFLFLLLYTSGGGGMTFNPVMEDAESEESMSFPHYIFINTTRRSGPMLRQAFAHELYHQIDSVMDGEPEESMIRAGPDAYVYLRLEEQTPEEIKRGIVEAHWMIPRNVSRALLFPVAAAGLALYLFFTNIFMLFVIPLVFGVRLIGIVRHTLAVISANRGVSYPSQGKYEDIKAVAKKWFDNPQSIATGALLHLQEGEGDIPFDRLGEAETEEIWSYRVSWKIAALASGFQKAEGLPRQAAYDIVHLTLSSITAYTLKQAMNVVRQRYADAGTSFEKTTGSKDSVARSEMRTENPFYPRGDRYAPAPVLDANQGTPRAEVDLTKLEAGTHVRILSRDNLVYILEVEANGLGKLWQEDGKGYYIVTLNKFGTLEPSTARAEGILRNSPIITIFPYFGWHDGALAPAKIGGDWARPVKDIRVYAARSEVRSPIEKALQEAFKQQSRLPVYAIAKKALDSEIGVISGTMGIPEIGSKASSNSRVVWTVSSGSSHATASSDGYSYVSLSMGDPTNSTLDTRSYQSSVASETGHLLHIAAGLLGGVNLHKGVAEAYDTLARSILKSKNDEGGSRSDAAWRKELKTEAEFGEAFLEFLKNYGDVTILNREQFLAEFLANLASKKIGQDATGELMLAAMDAHYGFDHYVGAYLVQSVLTKTNGNLEDAARLFGLSLREQEGIDFLNPEIFLKDLEKLPAKVLLQHESTQQSRSIFSLLIDVITSWFASVWQTFKQRRNERTVRQFANQDRLAILRESAIQDGELVAKGNAQTAAIGNDVRVAAKVSADVGKKNTGADLLAAMSPLDLDNLFSAIPAESARTIWDLVVSEEERLRRINLFLLSSHLEGFVSALRVSFFKNPPRWFVQLGRSLRYRVGLARDALRDKLMRLLDRGASHLQDQLRLSVAAKTDLFAQVRQKAYTELSAADFSATALYLLSLVEQNEYGRLQTRLNQTSKFLASSRKTKFAAATESKRTQLQTTVDFLTAVLAGNKDKVTEGYAQLLQLTPENDRVERQLLAKSVLTGFVVHLYKQGNFKAANFLQLIGSKELSADGRQQFDETVGLMQQRLSADGAIIQSAASALPLAKSRSEMRPIELGTPGTGTSENVAKSEVRQLLSPEALNNLSDDIGEFVMAITAIKQVENLFPPGDIGTDDSEYKRAARESLEAAYPSQEFKIRLVGAFAIINRSTLYSIRSTTTGKQYRGVVLDPETSKAFFPPQTKAAAAFGLVLFPQQEFFKSYGTHLLRILERHEVAHLVTNEDLRYTEEVEDRFMSELLSTLDDTLYDHFYAPAEIKSTGAVRSGFWAVFLNFAKRLMDRFSSLLMGQRVKKGRTAEIAPSLEQIKESLRLKINQRIFAPEYVGSYGQYNTLQWLTLRFIVAAAVEMIMNRAHANGDNLDSLLEKVRQILTKDLINLEQSKAAIAQQLWEEELVDVKQAYRSDIERAKKRQRPKASEIDKAVIASDQFAFDIVKQISAATDRQLGSEPTGIRLGALPLPRFDTTALAESLKLLLVAGPNVLVNTAAVTRLQELLLTADSKSFDAATLEGLPGLSSTLQTGILNPQTISPNETSFHMAPGLLGLERFTDEFIANLFQPAFLLPKPVAPDNPNGEPLSSETAKSEMRTSGAIPVGLREVEQFGVGLYGWEDTVGRMMSSNLWGSAAMVKKREMILKEFPEPTVYYMGIGSPDNQKNSLFSPVIVGIDVAGPLIGTGYRNLVGADLADFDFDGFQGGIRTNLDRVFDPATGEKVTAGKIEFQQLGERRFRVTFQYNGVERVVTVYSGIDLTRTDFVPEEIEKGYHVLSISGAGFWATPNSARAVLGLLSPKGFVIGGNDAADDTYGAVSPHGHFEIIEAGSFEVVGSNIPILIVRKTGEYEMGVTNELENHGQGGVITTVAPAVPIIAHLRRESVPAKISIRRPIAWVMQWINTLVDRIHDAAAKVVGDSLYDTLEHQKHSGSSFRFLIMRFYNPVFQALSGNLDAKMSVRDSLASVFGEDKSILELLSELDRFGGPNSQKLMAVQHFYWRILKKEAAGFGFRPPWDIQTLTEQGAKRAPKNNDILILTPAQLRELFSALDQRQSDEPWSRDADAFPWLDTALSLPVLINPNGELAVIADPAVRAQLAGESNAEWGLDISQSWLDVAKGLLKHMGGAAVLGLEEGARSEIREGLGRSIMNAGLLDGWRLWEQANLTAKSEVRAGDKRLLEKFKTVEGRPEGVSERVWDKITKPYVVEGSDGEDVSPFAQLLKPGARRFLDDPAKLSSPARFLQWLTGNKPEQAYVAGILNEAIARFAREQHEVEISKVKEGESGEGQEEATQKYFEPYGTFDDPQLLPAYDSTIKDQTFRELENRGFFKGSKAFQWFIREVTRVTPQNSADIEADTESEDDDQSDYYDAVKEQVKNILNQMDSGKIHGIYERQYAGNNFNAVTNVIAIDLPWWQSRILDMIKVASLSVVAIYSSTIVKYVLFLVKFSLMGVAGGAIGAAAAFVINLYLYSWVKGGINKAVSGLRLNYFLTKQPELNYQRRRQYVSEEDQPGPVYVDKNQYKLARSQARPEEEALFEKETSPGKKVKTIEIQLTPQENQRYVKLRLQALSREIAGLDTEHTRTESKASKREAAIILKILAPMLLDAFSHARWYPPVGRNSRFKIDQIVSFMENLVTQEKGQLTQQQLAWALTGYLLTEIGISKSSPKNFVRNWLPPIRLFGLEAVRIHSSMRNFYATLEKAVPFDRFRDEVARRRIYEEEALRSLDPEYRINSKKEISAQTKERAEALSIWLMLSDDKQENIKIQRESAGQPALWNDADNRIITKLKAQGTRITDSMIAASRRKMRLEHVIEADRFFFAQFISVVKKNLPTQARQSQSPLLRFLTAKQKQLKALVEPIERKMEKKIRRKQAGGLEALRFKGNKFLLDFVEGQLSRSTARYEKNQAKVARERAITGGLLLGAFFLNEGRKKTTFEDARRGQDKASGDFVLWMIHRGMQWKMFLSDLQKEDGEILTQLDLKPGQAEKLIKLDDHMAYLLMLRRALKRFEKQVDSAKYKEISSEFVRKIRDELMPNSAWSLAYTPEQLTQVGRTLVDDNWLHKHISAYAEKSGKSARNDYIKQITAELKPISRSSSPYLAVFKAYESLPSASSPTASKKAKKGAKQARSEMRSQTQGELLSLRTNAGRLANVDRYLMAFFEEAFKDKPGDEIRMTDVGIGLMPHVPAETTVALGKTFPGKKIQVTGVEIEDVQRMVVLDEPWLNPKYKGHSDQRYHEYQSILLNGQNQIVAVLTRDNENAISAEVLASEESVEELQVLEQYVQRALADERGFRIVDNPWQAFIADQNLTGSVTILQGADYRNAPPKDLQGKSDILRIFNIPSEINFEAIAQWLAEDGYAVVGYSPFQSNLPMEKFGIFQKRNGILVPVQYVFSTDVNADTGPEWIDNKEHQTTASVSMLLGLRGAHAWEFSRRLNTDFVDQDDLNENILWASWLTLLHDSSKKKERSQVLQPWFEKLKSILGYDMPENQLDSPLALLVTLDNKTESFLQMKFAAQFSRYSGYVKDRVHDRLGLPRNENLGVLTVKRILNVLLAPFIALWFYFSALKTAREFQLFSQRQMREIRDEWVEKAVQLFNGRKDLKGRFKAERDLANGYFVIKPTARSEVRTATADQPEKIQVAKRSWFALVIDEVLTNSGRKATNITVRLVPSPRKQQGIRVIMEDDGPGFDTRALNRAAKHFHSKFAGKNGLFSQAAQGTLESYLQTITDKNPRQQRRERQYFKSWFKSVVQIISAEGARNWQDYETFLYKMPPGHAVFTGRQPDETIKFSTLNPDSATIMRKNPPPLSMEMGGGATSEKGYQFLVTGFPDALVTTTGRGRPLTDWAVKVEFKGRYKTDNRFNDEKGANKSRRGFRFIWDVPIGSLIPDGQDPNSVDVQKAVLADAWSVIEDTAKSVRAAEKKREHDILFKFELDQEGVLAAAKSEMRNLSEVVAEPETPAEEIETPPKSGISSRPSALSQAALADRITVGGVVYEKFNEGGQGVVFKASNGNIAKVFKRTVSQEDLEGLATIILKLANDLKLPVATVRVEKTSDGTPVLVSQFVEGKALGDEEIHEDVLVSARAVLDAIDRFGEEFLGVKGLADRHLPFEDYRNFLMGTDGVVNIDPININTYLKARAVNDQLKKLLQLEPSLENVLFFKGKGTDADQVIISLQVREGDLDNHYTFTFSEDVVLAEKGFLKIERNSQNVETKDWVTTDWSYIEAHRPIFTQFFLKFKEKIRMLKKRDPARFFLKVKEALKKVQPLVNLSAEDARERLAETEVSVSEPAVVVKETVENTPDVDVGSLIQSLERDLASYTTTENPKTFTEAEAKEFKTRIDKIEAGLEDENTEYLALFQKQTADFRSLVSQLVTLRIEQLTKGLSHYRSLGDGTEKTRITRARSSAYASRIKALETMIQQNGLAANLAANLAVQRKVFGEVEALVLKESSFHTIAPSKAKSETPPDRVLPKTRSEMRTVETEVGLLESEQAKSQEKTVSGALSPELSKKLKTVLDELFVNAWEAALKGPAKKPVVRVQLNVTQDKGIVISTDDNGLGLNPVQVRAVVDYFAQTHDHAGYKGSEDEINKEKEWWAAVTRIHALKKDEVPTDEDITTFMVFRPGELFFSSKKPASDLGLTMGKLGKDREGAGGYHYLESTDENGVYPTVYVAANPNQDVFFSSGRSVVYLWDYIIRSFKGKVAFYNRPLTGFTTQVSLPEVVVGQTDHLSHYEEEIRAIIKAASNAAKIRTESLKLQTSDREVLFDFSYESQEDSASVLSDNDVVRVASSSEETKVGIQQRSEVRLAGAISKEQLAEPVNALVLYTLEDKVPQLILWKKIADGITNLKQETGVTTTDLINMIRDEVHAHVEQFFSEAVNRGSSISSEALEIVLRSWVETVLLRKIENGFTVGVILTNEDLLGMSKIAKAVVQPIQEGKLKSLVAIGTPQERNAFSGALGHNGINTRTDVRIASENNVNGIRESALEFGQEAYLPVIHSGRELETQNPFIVGIGVNPSEKAAKLSVGDRGSLVELEGHLKVGTGEVVAGLTKDDAHGFMSELTQTFADRLRHNLEDLLSADEIKDLANVMEEKMVNGRLDVTVTEEKAMALLLFVTKFKAQQATASAA